MKYILIMMFMVSFLFADENQRSYAETTVLSASASTDVELSSGFDFSTWKGTITLAIDPVLGSGTAQDIVITAKHKFDGLDYSQTAETVGTIAAADVTAGNTVYFDITGLSWFLYTENIQFTYTGASGTYGATLTIQIKGQ